MSITPRVVRIGMLSAVICGSLLQEGEAALITFQYAGTVVEVQDISGNLGGSISVGSSFIHTYTFESATPATIQSPTFTEYFDAIVDRRISFADGPTFVFAASSLQDIGIIDNDPMFNDTYFVNGDLQLFGNLNRLTALDEWHDGTATAISSFSLPLTPPIPADFTARTMQIRGNTSVQTSDLFIRGTTTSVIPEPSTIVLFSFGLLGLIRIRARRNTRRDTSPAELPTSLQS